MNRDFRSVFETKSLRAWDLQGDIRVTITRINNEKVGWGKQARTMPVFYFLELNKGLVCNQINGNTIVRLHGTSDPDELLGKEIILYPTTTEKQGEIVDCIRIRPKGYVPRGTPAHQARQMGAAANGKAQHVFQARPPVESAPKQQNPFPPSTQADQLIEDEQFKKDLEEAFTSIGFDAHAIELFTQHITRQMTIPDLYAMDRRQRSELLERLSAGRWNRFLANGQKQAVA